MGVTGAYGAIVVLPYTRVRRRSTQTPAFRMSHFTARAVLAGLELYLQGAASRFILPGEQRRPATSDLEMAFLQSRGVPAEHILTFPNRNGTLQQLEVMCSLQQRDRIGDVLVVCFAFHAERVRECLRLLGIRADIAEVEQTHVDFLHGRARSRRVDRHTLVNLPQLRAVRAAEQGISLALLRIDRPFGRLAPATRLFKLIAGPTITDIDHGRPRVRLARLEAIWRGAARLAQAVASVSARVASTDVWGFGRPALTGTATGWCPSELSTNR